MDGWMDAHGYFSRNFSWAFLPTYAMNMRTKFDVRSFTCSWDNWGYPKNWAVPGYAHAPFLPKFLMGFCSIQLLNVPAKFEVRLHPFLR